MQGIFLVTNLCWGGRPGSGNSCSRMRSCVALSSAATQDSQDRGAGGLRIPGEPGPRMRGALPPRTTTPAVPRSRPRPRRPEVELRGVSATSARGRTGCWLREAAGARSPMPANGAGDGFGGRRRLRGRGRRAGGGPSSPAALPHRGERRHRKREGKGLGGPEGPAAAARPVPRHSGRPGPAPVQRGDPSSWPRRGGAPPTLPAGQGPRCPHVRAAPAGAPQPSRQVHLHLSLACGAAPRGLVSQVAPGARSAQKRPGEAPRLWRDERPQAGHRISVFPVNCV